MKAEHVEYELRDPRTIHHPHHASTRPEPSSMVEGEIEEDVSEYSDLAAEIEYELLEDEPEDQPEETPEGEVDLDELFGDEE